MKRFFLLLPLFLLPAASVAQTAREAAAPADSLAFRGTFYSAEHGITLCLDLYAESLDVPGFSFLGKTSGYMTGDSDERLYGTWFLLSHKVSGNRATLRLSNDIGSDAQAVEFTRNADGTYTYRATGGNEVKKAVRRKLYKVASEMTFRRR